MDIFIAQQVEHYTFNVRVMGSNPIEDTAVNPLKKTITLFIDKLSVVVKYLIVILP